MKNWPPHFIRRVAGPWPIAFQDRFSRKKAGTELAYYIVIILFGLRQNNVECMRKLGFHNECTTLAGACLVPLPPFKKPKSVQVKELIGTNVV